MGAFNSKVIIGIGAVAVVAALAAVFLAGGRLSPPSSVDNSSETDSLVPLDKIVSGGPPRDGIPSIDEPKFVQAQQADLQDGDLVLRSMVMQEHTHLTSWCGMK